MPESAPLGELPSLVRVTDLRWYGLPEEHRMMRPNRKRKRGDLIEAVTNHAVNKLTHTQQEAGDDPEEQPAKLTKTAAAPETTCRLSSPITIRKEGPCGGFERYRTWHIDKELDGVIIQQVTRTFDVRCYQAGTWQPIAGGALDNYVPANSNE